MAVALAAHTIIYRNIALPSSPTPFPPSFFFSSPKKNPLVDPFVLLYFSLKNNPCQVCDELEDEDGIDISSGGKIVECHAVDFFPERYFKLVLVLRTDNTVLWERLASRGYPQSKIQENVQAEIMQVLLEESRDSYKPEIVKELQNDTIEQLEQNVVNAVKFVQGVV